MLIKDQPVYVEEVDRPFLIPTRVLNLKDALLYRICDFVDEGKTTRTGNKERALNNISRFFEIEND